jgi:hypothetical protein
MTIDSPYREPSYRLDFDETIRRGDGSLAAGWSCSAAGENSVAIGYMSRALGHHSVALGDRAVAAKDGSVAIGPRLVFYADGTIMIDDLPVLRDDPAIARELRDAVRSLLNMSAVHELKKMSREGENK